MSTPFSVNDFIEVRIVSAGDDCACYTYDPAIGGLRLSGFHRTPQPAPCDRAEVPDSSPDGADNVPVWLLMPRSAFPGTVVTARPIGLLVSRDGAREWRRVVAVAAADPQSASIRTPDDLSEERRQALMAFACHEGAHTSPTMIVWEPAQAAHAWIHQARQQARLARAGRKQGPARPAWKPLGYRVAGARRLSEAEPHSEAEYAYHQLPFRFQKYVDEYLAPGERILFAVNRPAMKSAFKHLFAPRPTLQEGILFVTDQQLTLVAEIVPPDSANIRYGYIAHTAPPERVASIEVALSHQGSAMLTIVWRAAQGQQTTIWEFPAEAAAELREAAAIVSRWQPEPDDRRLRRATPPAPLRLPLRDPASNSADDIAPIVARLEAAIASELRSRETVLARALLPAWVEHRGYAEALVVTHQRLLRIPDPAAARHLPRSLDLAEITSVEFSMSILESYLALHTVREGRPQVERIVFPYTGSGFKECFTVLRQQMGSIAV